MKKFLFLPLLLLLSFPAFSQTGLEFGAQIGTNFSRLNTYSFCGFGETNSLNLRPNGINGGVKGAWNFHRNFAVEMSASANHRWVNYWDNTVFRCFPVLSCDPRDSYMQTHARQLDLEHQTRIRYKLLAGRRIQPWVSTGVTQFFRLRNPIRNGSVVTGDFADPIAPNPNTFDNHKYDIAMVHAAGVRIKLNQLVALDMEASLRHFPQGGSGYRRNILPSTNMGVIFTPGI